MESEGAAPGRKRPAWEQENRHSLNPTGKRNCIVREQGLGGSAGGRGKKRVGRLKNRSLSSRTAASIGEEEGRTGEEGVLREFHEIGTDLTFILLKIWFRHDERRWKVGSREKARPKKR